MMPCRISGGSLISRLGHLVLRCGEIRIGWPVADTSTCTVLITSTLSLSRGKYSPYLSSSPTSVVISHLATLMGREGTWRCFGQENGARGPLPKVMERLAFVGRV